MLGKKVKGLGKIALLSAYIRNIDLNAQNIGFILDKDGCYQCHIVDFGFGLKMRGKGSELANNLTGMFCDRQKLWEFATHFTGLKKENYYSINLISPIEIDEIARDIIKTPPSAIKAVCDKYEA